MNTLLAIGLLLLNLVISYANAKTVGHCWVETKHEGGWKRLMAWSGAAMSALGFTWCFAIIALFGCVAFHKLSIRAAEAGLYLTYLCVIPGVLFFGLMIWINSLANAYRERTLANVGTAGYNSFANVYNYYNAIKDVPDAFDNVLDFFTKDDDDAGKTLVFLIVIGAALLGVMTTYYIVTTTAAHDEPLPMEGLPTLPRRARRNI